MVFKQILLKAKDPTLPQETRGVVYEIKCAGNGRDFNGTNSEMSRGHKAESKCTYTSTLNSIYIQLINNACAIFVNIFLGTK